MKKWLFTAFCLLLQISLFGEKWVGQVATYQLAQGEKTASSELFNIDGLSAACNGFKLGATVEVINIANGKSVQVKINDRLSSESKYFILLSPKAAGQIDLAWETGPVVVSADFSAVNSTDILPVNGLLSEGTYDEEKVRNFPSITWPDETSDTVKDETADAPPIVTEPMPIPEVAVLPVEPAPIKEVPADTVPTAETATDIDQTSDTTPKEKTAAPAPTPVQKKEVVAETSDALISPAYKTPDHVKPVEVVKEKKAVPQIAKVEKTVTPQPVKETPAPVVIPPTEPIKKEPAVVPVPLKETPKVVPEKKKPEPEPISSETFDKISWTTSLDNGKAYIKFFTSSKPDDFAVKYFNYIKLFGKIIAFKKGNLYHLLTGPVPEEKINSTVNSIRNFGFRDAYIITGGKW